VVSARGLPACPPANSRRACTGTRCSLGRSGCRPLGTATQYRPRFRVLLQPTGTRCHPYSRCPRECWWMGEGRLTSLAGACVALAAVQVVPTARRLQPQMMRWPSYLASSGRPDIATDSCLWLDRHAHTRVRTTKSCLSSLRTATYDSLPIYTPIPPNDLLLSSSSSVARALPPPSA
jgi:hypothetical protein